MLPTRFQKTRPFLINASGFTLGQLIAALLIINITAFVVSTFYTVLQQASSYARTSSCHSNLKQVNLGLLQYAADYDECFPQCAMATKSDHALTGWAAFHDRNGGSSAPKTATVFPFIGGYLMSERVLRCPETSNRSEAVSYMLNDLAAGVARKDFAAPQNTILVCDGEDFAGNVGHAYDPSVPPSPPFFSRDGVVALGATLQTAPTRHSSRALFSFADGHIKSSRPEAIYFPPRRSNSRSHIDESTGDTLAPNPTKLSALGYTGTFHIK